MGSKELWGGNTSGFEKILEQTYAYREKILEAKPLPEMLKPIPLENPTPIKKTWKTLKKQRPQ